MNPAFTNEAFGELLDELTHGHFGPLDYHRVMLSDRVRMLAFERALAELVSPGDVVLDVGAGTGILAMLAVRNGAKRVHAVESMAVAGLAKAIVAANGMSDRVIVHNQDIVLMEPLEPVDLIVSDFLGRFLIDDGMMLAIEQSAAWLKPEGRFCPRRVDLLLAPVGDFRLEAVDFFGCELLGFDFSSAVPYSLNTCYRVELEPAALLAPGLVFGSYTPPAEAQPFANQLRYRLQRGGRLQGVAGWFSATLTPEVVLSTEPGVRTHWGQYLFPLPPTEVRVGDEMHLSLVEHRLFGGDSRWEWTAKVVRGGRTVLECTCESSQRLGEREG